MSLESAGLDTVTGMDVVEVDIMLVSAGAGDDEIDVGEGCGVDGVAGKLGTASASAIEGSCRVPFPMKSRIGAGAKCFISPRTTAMPHESRLSAR